MAVWMVYRLWFKGAFSDNSSDEVNFQEHLFAGIASFEITLPDISVSWGRLWTCLVPWGVQCPETKVRLLLGELLMAPF